MAFIYTTQSGSKHYVDHFENVYKRLPGDASHELYASLRQDGELLSFFSATLPNVGDDLIVVLQPLGEGDVTVRRTTPVVAIEVV